MPGFDTGEQDVGIDVDEAHLSQRRLRGTRAGQPVKHRVGHRADVGTGGRCPP